MTPLFNLLLVNLCMFQTACCSLERDRDRDAFISNLVESNGKF